MPRCSPSATTSPAPSRSWSRHYQHRLVGVHAPPGRQREEAEDLAQEVFLRVYRARKKYRPRSKFSTWLFTIANNLALNACAAGSASRWCRSTSATPARWARGRPSSWCATGNQPSKRMQQQELAAVVRQALDGLNERQRMAVVLNKFEDMNYAEIAEVMGLTTKAVKSLLSRARTTCAWPCRDYIYMDGDRCPSRSDE